MRDGLLREREPLGDDAAHGVVRHKLVAARLVEARTCLSERPAGGARPRQHEAALRLGFASAASEHLCVFGDARHRRRAGCRA